MRIDDFATMLAGSSAWEIEVHEKRCRPAGAASASYHVDDIVLRARRRVGVILLRQAPDLDQAGG